MQKVTQEQFEENVKQLSSEEMEWVIDGVYYKFTIDSDNGEWLTAFVFLDNEELSLFAQRSANQIEYEYVYKNWFLWNFILVEFFVIDSSWEWDFMSYQW